MSESPMLAARGVAVRYPGGHEALAGVDLEVARGETLALVGESGSGKTTLLRCFNRLVEPQQGEIELRGEPIRSQDPVQLRRHIGYVQQDGGLLPHWTVERNVGLVPSLQGWDAGRIAQRVRESLALVGLAFETFADRYPRRLSGGQRQRVAVARALAADPDVVLLDEPFGALDPISRAGLQSEFLAWKSRLGKTLVLVTHDLGEAFRLGDRIAVLRAGKLEQVGRPEEIERAPRTEHVRELLRLGSR